MLRIANSAYYGMMKKVDSVRRAITIIGFDEVISIAIGMSVFDSFKDSKLNSLMNIRDLWIHSIGCATAAKEVAKMVGTESLERIFLIGILHDIGKIIFAANFLNEYKEVLEAALNDMTELHIKEREIIGIDHAKISGLLMDRWNFPDSIIFPARYHHAVLKCPPDYKRDAMILALSDFICHRSQIGHSGNPSVPNVLRVIEDLGMSPHQLDSIEQKLYGQKDKMEAFLNALS